MKRIVYNLDPSWRFHLGELPAPPLNSHSTSYTSCKAGHCAGGGAVDLPDTDWRVLDLPHDYLTETDFAPENLISHGYKTRCNAWYRKTFLLPKECEGQHVLLCFDGLAVTAEIYCNGSLVARSFSAYAELPIDITERIHAGGENVLAVHINGLETEGWWYEGAGIYRHVRLFVKSPCHIAHNGLYLRPVLREGTENDWDVTAQVTAECTEASGPLSCRVTLLRDGVPVVCGQSGSLCVPDHTPTPLTLTLPVSAPARWDVDTPNLYTAKAELLDAAGNVLDTEETRFGFRTFAPNPAGGFFLNGRPIRLFGTCNHQDHAGVGCAVPDSLIRYRIRRLKEMGSNAYRCAHNLPNREVLDACDEMGLLVMDENRRFECRPDVLEQVRGMIVRDRNHPCVVMWSLFNEEPLQNTPEGRKIYRRLRQEAQKLDNTRLFTGAINGYPAEDGGATEMDVVGINYCLQSVTEFHKKHPSVPIYGSENHSAVSTRGCFATDNTAHVLAGYDEEAVPWGQTILETRQFLREHPYYGGFFAWTGFDYRGEPTPFEWPSVTSQFGILDLCGFDKSAFWFHRACLTEEPMLKLFPHWNHREGERVRVMVATNCEEAELFLNGVSLGRRASAAECRAEWSVPFSPGTLIAVGTRQGREAARDTVCTTGAPCRIVLVPDRLSPDNDGADTVPVTVYTVDENNRPVPWADNLLSFTIRGDGQLAGVGNGNPNSHESDHAPARRLFAGRCQVLLRTKAGGRAMTLHARGEGLEEASVTLTLRPVPQPLTLPLLSGRSVSHLTMSVAMPMEKPDPLLAVSDNDMNSFTPVTLRNGVCQTDFTQGWRLYRAPLRVAESGILRLESLYVRYAEIYFCGMRVYAGNPPAGGALSCPLQAGEGELRLLLQAQADGSASGLAGGLSLVLPETES